MTGNRLQTTQLRKSFDKQQFRTGASTLKIWCWYLVSIFFFRSGMIPFSNVLVFILKLFGARIGKDVRIKPSVYIRYPWKLSLGDHSWLADCYIDNLDHVIIGKNVCISQQAMLLTGNHNYKCKDFNLYTRPITLEDGVWIAARAIVCPGVTAYSHAVLLSAAVADTALQAYSVYQGNPAIMIRKRKISPNYSIPLSVDG
jgi:putative colanic acid biosynthesis acetyltransferase WcaF